MEEVSHVREVDSYILGWSTVTTKPPDCCRVDMVPASKMRQRHVAPDGVCKSLFFVSHYGLCAFAQRRHQLAANASNFLSCMRKQTGMTGASLKSVCVNASVDT